MSRRIKRGLIYLRIYASVIMRRIQPRKDGDISRTHTGCILGTGETVLTFALRQERSLNALELINIVFVV